LRLENEAADIERAIEMVLAEGWRTADLLRAPHPASTSGPAAAAHSGNGAGLAAAPAGGLRRVTTTEMGALVERALADMMNMRHSYHAV